MKPNFNLQVPSKKILYLIGAILLLFIILFSYKPLIQAYKNGAFQGSLSYNEGAEQNPTDSDGDGLKDWQETLWETDSNDPDSDNDGTTDGEEVSVGRNPVKSGPDDVLTSLIQVVALTNSAEFLNNPDNLSQQFAQKLFAQVASVGNNGEIDEGTEADIINDALDTFQAQAIEPYYVQSNLKILESINANSLKVFGTAVVTIQDPLFNLPDSATNDQIIKVYNDMIIQLANLQVPRELSTSYLNLLNNYYAMRQLLIRITTGLDDPVKVLLDTKTSQELTLKNRDIYKQYALYFKNNGILWGNNEPGDVWNSY